VIKSTQLNDPKENYCKKLMRAEQILKLPISIDCAQIKDINRENRKIGDMGESRRAATQPNLDLLAS